MYFYILYIHHVFFISSVYLFTSAVLCFLYICFPIFIFPIVPKTFLCIHCEIVKKYKHNKYLNNTLKLLPEYNLDFDEYAILFKYYIFISYITNMYPYYLYHRSSYNKSCVKIVYTSVVYIIL